EHAVSETLTSVVFLSVFVLGGVLLLVYAYRRLTTLVRFAATEQTVVVDWHRGSRQLRSEQFAMVDITDVLVDQKLGESPGIRIRSGNRITIRFRQEYLHRIIIRTRRGDTALSDYQSDQEGFYRSKCHDIAAFLNVRENTSSI